jgi:hypothetical protein
MRFAGIVFLLVGVMLCATITWAGAGFVAMSFGLIALMIAEQRSGAASRLSTKSEAQPSSPTRMAVADQVAQEQVTWNRLVEQDEDIARVVKALLPFGQKYVDQLSRTYLIFNDKACLPIILRMITLSAGNGADAALALVPGGSSDLTAIPLRRTGDFSASAIATGASHGEARPESSQIGDQLSAKTPLPITDLNPAGPHEAIPEEKELKLLLGRIASGARESQ